MNELVKQYSRKVNTAPGTLHYTGKHSTKVAEITLFTYDESDCNKKDNLIPSDLKGILSNQKNNWVLFSGLQHIDKVQQVGEVFNLHPLDLEDIVTVEQFPKFEDKENYLYFTLKFPFICRTTHKLKTEHFSLFLFENTLLVFSDEKETFFSEIIERLTKNLGKVRKMGSDYMFFRLVDKIVDFYFEILDGLQDSIDKCETNLLKDKNDHSSHQILNIKKELIKFRKAVLPLNNAIDQVCKSDNTLISKEVHLYLREIKDNAYLIIQTLYSFNDLMTGLMDLYLSNQSNQMNNVMKILTVVGSIFIPLTFIVGIYGMNIPNMPEMGWNWFYPTLMITMTVGSLVMFFVMR